MKGVGANNANDRGVRLMHMACQTGNSHLVQRLLELGEKRRGRDWRGALQDVSYLSSTLSCANFGVGNMKHFARSLREGAYVVCEPGQVKDSKRGRKSRP